MSIFSKPLVLQESCYEVGHTWTPSCTQAALDVAFAGFKFSFKTYSLLYLITAIARRRSKDYFIRRLIPEILQSTVFLGTNAVGFITGFCLWRWLVGRYYLWTTIYCPAFTGSLFAILLERKQRRGLLTVYVTQVATQILYNMLVWRGLAPKFRNGEVYLFSAISALYMYLYKKKDELSGGSLMAFRFLVGAEEQLGFTPKVDSGAAASSNWSILLSYVNKARSKLCEGLPALSHTACRHSNGCIQYILEGGLKLFSVGWSVQAVLSLIGVLRGRKTLSSAFTNRDNISFAAFLGSFSAIFRLVSCLLRWIRGKDTQLNGLVAGALAGLSMFHYKSSNLTAYIGSKLCEFLYLKGASAGYLPTFYYGDVLLYAISTALLFHVCVFECHNMTPTYWRFLLQITDGKFALMDRKLLDHFGTQASKLFPDFVSPVQKI